LLYDDIRPQLEQLTEALFQSVPTGMGRGGRFRFTNSELKQLMGEGPRFLMERGLAVEEDIELTEARGCIDGADPSYVSDRAMERGRSQCGTLGSGNHFLGVQVVAEVTDEPAAKALGLQEGQICVMIHSGSR